MFYVLENVAEHSAICLARSSKRTHIRWAGNQLTEWTWTERKLKSSRHSSDIPWQLTIFYAKSLSLELWTLRVSHTTRFFITSSSLHVTSSDDVTWRAPGRHCRAVKCRACCDGTKVSSLYEYDTAHRFNQRKLMSREGDQWLVDGGEHAQKDKISCLLVTWRNVERQQWHHSDLITMVDLWSVKYRSAMFCRPRYGVQLTSCYIVQELMQCTIIYTEYRSSQVYWYLIAANE